MSTILITGASSGIGKATARFFADKGWNVIATMRSPEKETELTGQENIEVIKLDVENRNEIHEAINSGIARFGRIDILLNNAGYGTMGVFEAATEEQLQKQFSVNVFGIFAATRAILPHFRANKSGIIINVSSMGGKITFPNGSLYHSTKFAIEGFTEGVYYELASQNIKVKIIEPGAIATDFMSRSMDHLVDESLTDYKEYLDNMNRKLLTMFAGNNFTQAEEVAAVIYQAATDDSDQLRYVIGEDARSAIEMRNQAGDEAYVKNTAQMFV
ncbi:SDR family oxidoreductase [Paenibacillus solisilvae]|uniref:SDR family oxidoreductase n=1 Tax=Paenibacillus solisilvae TaxID=2486751 RepID=A0ABW0VP80_9BACL